MNVTKLERWNSLKYPFIYVIIGGLWIKLSDYFLSMIVVDHDFLTKVQTYKGWIFIIFTAWLLYKFIHYENAQQRKANDNLSMIKQDLQKTLRYQNGMTYKFKKVQGRFIHTLCDGELLYRIGLTPEQVIGKELHDFLPTETVFQKKEYYRKAWQEECNVTYECRFGNVTSLISLRPIKENGKVTEIIAHCTDITERKKIQEELVNTQEQMKSLADSLDVVLWSLEVSSNTVLQISSGAEKIYGYPPEKFLHDRDMWKAVQHPEDISNVEAMQSKLLNEKAIIHEYRIIHSSGEIKWVEDRTIPITNEGGHIVQLNGVTIDITKRKQAEEIIQYLAFHDPLSNLPNRRQFINLLHEGINHAKENNHKLAIMFLDVDRFKTINDSLGHTIGDCLLQLITERLITCVGKEATVARIGGDEFAILFSQIDDKKKAISIAKHLLEAFHLPFTIEGRDLHITPSIGIAFYPTHGNDVETLLKRVDTAMYYTKEHGKNNYKLYTESMDERVYEHLILENELRKALDRNQFLLYYQPKIDTNTYQIIGMEALIRWLHPELGLISPTKFIPMAEETGMIIPLGEQILHMACKQNMEWQNMGYPPFRMAINLSARQFKQDNLVEMIDKILKETGLESKWLEVEITESAIMDNVENTIDILHQLKMMGIQVSIDDFGTGYSSLSYLKKFPIDTLKIDQSFVRDIPLHSDDMAIVNAIISMAKNLHLNVIAEGVETEEQLVFLRENGCFEMQGYLFSQPITAKEFGKFLMESKEFPSHSWKR